ncbi:MAG: GDP-mannose 4,6-dehydratase [Alphaproteobacteria bacterium]|nr:MAG: GDP-mannose 4,6-dehydratase [Alphaproteobacteria bacterium]
MGKVALITGITGQDGAYLAKFLLDKGYDVHGIVRPTSLPNDVRLHYLLGERFNMLTLHHGDLTDALSLLRIVQETQPDEIYNLAAQSHVKVSFEQPEYTGNADGLGVLRLLEAIRIAGLEQKTRFYQASTSELYGKVTQTPQNEETPFYPRSPYGVAKLYAFWTTKNYRESYDMHASNGILFNHESPLRGETFVSRKITKAVVDIQQGTLDKLTLGKLDAQRDWGHARDYVEGMWLMLQQDQPDDYVFATGETHTVRKFVELAFGHFDKDVRWDGQGLDEKGYDAKTGQLLVDVSAEFFRPAEVDTLLGDPTKAKEKLGWEWKTSFKDLITEMIEVDLKADLRAVA